MNTHAAISICTLLYIAFIHALYVRHIYSFSCLGHVFAYNYFVRIVPCNRIEEDATTIVMSQELSSSFCRGTTLKLIFLYVIEHMRIWLCTHCITGYYPLLGIHAIGKQEFYFTISDTGIYIHPKTSLVKERH